VLYKITNFFIIGCVAGLLIRSLCFKKPYNFVLLLCFIIANRML